MRRILIVVTMLVALGASLPLHASPTTGTIRTAVLTPSVPRMMYTAMRDNGTTGYVLELPNGSAGKAYTLSLLDGATHLEDLDAYFYTDLRGNGTPCARDARQRGTTETGSVTCSGRAIWAVIVLASGANARFSFDV